MLAFTFTDAVAPQMRERVAEWRPLISRPDTDDLGRKPVISTAAELNEPVATAEAHLLRTDGSVGAATVDYADSYPTRLVVIGARGLSSVRSALTGSVRQHVAKNVHVLVLPVNPEGRRRLRRRTGSRRAVSAKPRRNNSDHNPGS
jgi:nucleotide-binding universal stress UspA family protein